ncbi:MAG: O-methyltransferase [Lachnospiraceae bacterium]|nr:O-methyltransferase [Lachnospiraceae bacterium]
MIIEERMADYIASLESEMPEYLSVLEKHALENEVPIIRKDSQALLRFLIELTRPSAILEIGAAIGFSAAFMSEYMPEGCKLTTIEKVEMRLVEARKNLAEIRRAQDVTLIEDDALNALKRLREEGRRFDFIFMDAAKAQYMNFLENALPMLKVGGVLVTDNVLQEGSIIDSKFAIERRDRTIHMRMRDYLFEIKHDSKLTTSIVAVGDGMALTFKKQD